MGILRKIVILCLYSCLLAFNSAGQSNGKSKWFTLSRNRIIEFTITEDSIVDRQLDWDLTPRANARNYRDARPIRNLTMIDGNIYSIYSDDKTDSSLKGIISIVPSKSFPELFFLINDSIDLSRGESLQGFIGSHAKEKFGIFLLSESYFNKLKSQKSIDNMTPEDLKKYIAFSSQIGKQLDSLGADIKTSNARLFGGYFMIRYIFGKIGYNPLYTNKQFEAMIKKFQDRDDTKEQLEHFFNQ